MRGRVSVHRYLGVSLWDGRGLSSLTRETVAGEKIVGLAGYGDFVGKGQGVDWNPRLYLLVRFNGLGDPKPMKEGILQRFRRWQVFGTPYGHLKDRNPNSGSQSRIPE